MAEATHISENLVHEWKHVRNTTEQSFIEDSYEFPNDNFIFFWWDAHENQYDGKGTVHFFGRSYDPVDKSFKSCCLTLNMQRNIFLLPRTNFKLDPARSVTLKDVHDEFNDRIAVQLGLPSFSSRNVSKTHCFDVNVPRRAEYLQIRYSAEYPALKYTAGNTFSRVFGANQSFLEMFLLERNIKGPCWLEVKNATKDTKALTRCHFNIKCANVADVSVVKIDREPPPLVAFVLRVRTVEDTVAMRHKIVMLAWVVQEKYRISDVGAFNRHMFTFTGPHGDLFSNQLYEEMEKCNVAGREFDDERQLLNHFLQQIGKIDPDLIIGHDLLGHDLDALHSRIQDLKINEHVNLGRFRVNRLPKSSTCHRQMFIGRMLCDLKLSAEELIKCKTYDLDSMVQQVLETKRQKIEQSCSDWKEALKSGIFQLLDAAYILRLTQKLGVVAVALSLTNVCGNTMARTLLGGRSERNEFLLLHAFHERGHIVPNRSKKGKPWRGRSNKSITGGLVLPPHVGLYGSYVLLMDFMSLYPSIIREYNVCPSTFALTKNFKIVLPARGAPLGVLPQIVTNLIEKRCTTENETYKTALKMTANSMFGYLGYPSSRFYSKYLAVYIITKGREILTNAVATIKEMKHNVIYGDTDSVMVQIDSSNYSDVIETSKLIMSKVNSRYSHVQLEVDTVFSQLLLLAKKKYAAVCVDDAHNFTRLNKGLEIVRRDWSNLSARVAEKVLDFIFTKNDCYASIVHHLIKVKTSIARYPLKDFTMTRRLAKNLEQYSNEQQMHIAAAKRSKNRFKIGDDVTFIVCDDGVGGTYIERAYCLEDVLENSKKLRPDKTYYLSKQVYPVVRRLCSHVKNFNLDKLTTLLYPNKKENPGHPNPVLTINPNTVEVNAFIFMCVSCGTKNVITDHFDFLNNCENEKCQAKPVEYFDSVCHDLKVSLQRCVAESNEAICTNPCCGEAGVYAEPADDGPVVCETCSIGELKLKHAEFDLWKKVEFYKDLCDFEGETGHAIYYDQLLHLSESIANEFRYGIVDMGAIFSKVTQPAL